MLCRKFFLISGAFNNGFLCQPNSRLINYCMFSRLSTRVFEKNKLNRVNENLF